MNYRPSSLQLPPHVQVNEPVLAFSNASLPSRKQSPPMMSAPSESRPPTPVSLYPALAISRTTESCRQARVQTASERMACELRALPTFTLTRISAHMEKMDTIEIIIPQKVLSGLCPR